MLLQLGVEVLLLLGILGHGLDHVVGVAEGLVPVGDELEVLVGSLDVGLEGLALLGRAFLLGHQAVGIGARIGLHSLESVEVDFVQTVDLGLAAADRALAAQPDGDVVAHVGGLEGDLASQHAAARDDDLLDIFHVHGASFVVVPT